MQFENRNRKEKNFFLLTVVSNCNFFKKIFVFSLKKYTTFSDMYTLLYVFIFGCAVSSFLHVEEEMATRSSILAWEIL